MYKVQFLRATRVKLTAKTISRDNTHPVDIKAGKSFYIQDIQETLEPGVVRLIIEPICLDGGKYYTVNKADIATKLYDIKFNQDKSKVQLNGVFDQPELMKLADLMPRVVPNYKDFWVKLQNKLYEYQDTAIDESHCIGGTKAIYKHELIQTILMDMMDIELDAKVEEKTLSS